MGNGYVLSPTKDKSSCNNAIVIAIVFVFLTVLSVVPLLFVHENKALRTVGNRMFFLIMEVNCPPLAS